MKHSIPLISLALISVAAMPMKHHDEESSTSTLELGSRLELFVDDYLTDSMEGLGLKLHTPRSAGKVMVFDKPWEGVTSGSEAVVFQDGDLYRMYYRGSSHAGYALESILKPGEVVVPEHPHTACYAESRDAVHWNRFLEAFIRPGLGVRNWVHRTNTPAWGLLSLQPDEISLFIQRDYTFPSNYMERMVLRTDGFVSLHAGYSGGEWISKPLTFEGDKLVLNFATSAAGSIRMEIQDADGNPLSGFALEESPLIWGDEIEHQVVWSRSHAEATSDKPLRRLAGKPVRLRLIMKDADLFSLRFQ